MIAIGNYNELKVMQKADFGFFLDDGASGILLPNNSAPKDLAIGDTIKVFLYYDSEDRLIATTLTPKATVGETALLKVADVSSFGAFLDWGLPKDLLLPKSNQLAPVNKDEMHLVKIYFDEVSGRIVCTEKLEKYLSNEILTVAEMEAVNITIYRPTDIGFLCIVNDVHLGLMHYNDVFNALKTGDKITGYVKKIKDENRLDVMPGKRGYDKVSDEGTKILNLLQSNKGFLPYHDKSDPDIIYDVFGMSKKTFKMTIGNLYKDKKISLSKEGITLL
ncbi:MAG: S1-like domain-containing RNA-binding protein [Bacteroidetes bacterium]|nr:S1-like domain-containing RNA-binding protein [Bacteroidota bacterium]